MSKYSGFERKIAFILTKFLGIKLAIKKTMIGQGTIDKFGDGHPNVYAEKILFDTCSF